LKIKRVLENIWYRKILYENFEAPFGSRPDEMKRCRAMGARKGGKYGQERNSAKTGAVKDEQSAAKKSQKGAFALIAVFVAGLLPQWDV